MPLATVKTKCSILCSKLDCANPQSSSISGKASSTSQQGLLCLVQASPAGSGGDARAASMLAPLDGLEVNALLDEVPEGAHLPELSHVLHSQRYGTVHLRL